MIDDILAKPVTALAYGWRLERRDGVTLGFTSHDREVIVAGQLLQAAPGIEPTSIVEKMGFEIGGLDVRGALTATAINAKDLKAGRWDDAALSIFSFDWNDLDAPVQHLAEGRLGTVSWVGDKFETVFNGAAALLDRPVAPVTSPTCRAAFCDADCGLNRMRFVREQTVVAMQANMLSFASPANLPIDAFASGSLRWLDGQNCGLVSRILGNAANTAMLIEPPPMPVVLPAQVELFQGCEKTSADCRDRYSNMVNFRGEPHLPGNDLLTRYPGAG